MALVSGRATKPLAYPPASTCHTSNVRGVNARSASAENDAVAMSLILTLTSAGGLSPSPSPAPAPFVSRCLPLFLEILVFYICTYVYTEKKIFF